jgi:SAM-dependent methyltransferase
MNNTCRICGKGNNSEEYILKEMMFGTKDEFCYFKCSNCGCLQIKEFPSDIQSYYPSTYLPRAEYSAIKRYLRKQRDLYTFRRKGILGKILSGLFGFPAEYRWFDDAGFSKDDDILEVGCGRGDLLKLLYEAGFKNLLGIDPFIEKDLFYDKKFNILKKDLSQINKTFDWIMFHHSFEHLQNPHETFEKLKKVINERGKILIRIPLIDSYAWEKYKTDWVQLDAPRHFFLYTIKSIEYISQLYGFIIKRIVYDSDSFQFWGSEQYKRNIPLMSPNSLFIKQNNSVFSNEVLQEFTKKANELNQNGQGDRASIYIERL